jgi:TonB family protein
MNAVILHVAMQIVRIWTAIYTWRLPTEIREARRADIASDLWSSVHDPDGYSQWSAALRIVSRLVLGVPDDLLWRFERRNARAPFLLRLAAAAACSMLALASAHVLWTTDVPPLPSRTVVPALADTPYPPPPPPPPPAVGAESALRSADRHPVFASTSYSVTTDGVPPVRLKEVRPVYPPIAMAFDLQGAVVVEARITDEGRVVDARVVEPVAMVLSRSAIQAVQQWEFARSGAGNGRNTLRVQVSFTRSP